LGRNGSVVNQVGLSRTSGKNVSWTKSTSDISNATVITAGPTANNGTTTAAAGKNADGVNLATTKFVDNITNAGHWVDFTAPSITNTTQVFCGWIGAGTGTNKRFVRVIVGSTNAVAPTNGFFADIDLQLGTIGTCTAIGNGTGTSSSIAAVGRGFWFQIIGKCSSAAATPTCIIAACSAAGTTSYAGDTTENFDYGNVQLITASSISDTTYNVADDTGWLSGDAVVIAPTQRTYTDSDTFLLSANAGASSIVSHEIPFGDGSTGNRLSTYSGTSPTQAEIGLLTRNVICRGSTSATTGWACIYLEPLCTYTAAWVEFYWLGANLAQRHGLVIAGTTAGSASAKSITYCSFEWSYLGVYLDNSRVGGNAWNTTVDHCVFYYSTIQWIDVTGPTAGGLSDFTITNNLVIRASLNAGIYLFDPQGTCSNNVCAGNVNAGIYMTPAITCFLGPHDSNVTHTNQNYGVELIPTASTITMGGLISNPKSYRNGSSGILTANASGFMGDIEIRNPIVFGNTTYGIANQNDGFTITGQGICSGDTSFGQVNGLLAQSNNNGIQAWNVDGLDMSGTTSIYAPNSSTDILVQTGTAPIMNMRGCKFGATTLISGLNANNGLLWGANCYIGMESFNQVAGDHRGYLAWGYSRTDPTIYNTSSPSQRVTPYSTINKCPSMPKQKGKLARVNSGDTLTVSVPVYKSQASDGAAYNGNQPRLILRANGALGVYTDQVLATYSGGTGSWNTLSGTTPTATDTGEFEFFVDCDGNHGWINIDNAGWTTSAP
jgi:hypothetical protein